MTEWLQLFPPYLIFLTLFLVIIPTIISFFSRIALYRELRKISDKVNRLIKRQSRGEEDKIVTMLETRFAEASQHLEQVNTPALIDDIYSRKKFLFCGISLPYEQWDYFTKILPNLLLAFGLLGTFLGITINLHDISQTIGQVDSDNLNLANKLQTPLQSMGIAFITSLIGLVCSSILTVINFIYNTNFAKHLLVSSLEDYLDNIYQPKIQGDTRLDKAVDRMVKQQEEFLSRFHEKVGQVLENTLRPVADRIAEENTTSHQLARQVYTSFIDASGTITTGANIFKETALSLEKQTKIITETFPKIHTSIVKLQEGTNTFKLAADKIEKSKFAENIESLTADLVNTQKIFSQSTAFFANQVQSLVENNQKANQLAESIYTQMQVSTEQLQNSANTFDRASQTIQDSQFPEQLQTATNNLTAFANSVTSLESSTQIIKEAAAFSHDSNQRLLNLSERTIDIQQSSADILTKTELQIDLATTKLSEVVATLKKHQEQVNIGLENFGSKVLTSFETKTGQTINKLDSFSIKLEDFSNNSLVNFRNHTQTLKETIDRFDNSNQRLSELGIKVVDIQQSSADILNKIERQRDRETTELSKVVATLKKHQEQVNIGLENFGSKVLNSFENQTKQSIKELKNIVKVLQK